MGKDYKDTLNLPSTDFPMRANLSDREPDQIEQWEEDDIYVRMIERREAEGAERFILHDGPPYANGNLHHGHILNKTLKDFIVKYRNLSGYLCEYVPGWDCHGLPIEHEVEAELGDDVNDLTKVEFRQACREYAAKYLDIQRDEFRRVMVFGDWDNPYSTMSEDYEATILREMGEFFDRDLVYRGLKPVHWDWGSETALAEAEVEYDTFKTEHVYVKFPFEELPDKFSDAVGDKPVYVLIWTTTPWTIPANLAIAMNPELEYELVEYDGEVLMMANGRREEVLEDCDIEESEVSVLTNFEGREIVGELGEDTGRSARHPWLERDSRLLPAPYVTLEQGTGCVHTAPGHGQEDFALGQEYGLDVICPVDEKALFKQDDENVSEWAGVHVLTANPKIAEKIDDLGLLLNEAGEKVTIDRYPYGDRSGKPVIFRATTQWFLAMDPENAGLDESENLREDVLSEVDDIEWIPEWGHDRMSGMVESRPDWCLSRQRSWGVPIPIVYCDGCGEAIVEKELADYAADLVAEDGTDVWFEEDADNLVPPDTECENCGSTTFEKEEDILDVWFDSGVSWSAVLSEKLGWGETADLYLEGSDQHRGWFQSSLICGVGTRGHSPYETCLTHGFVTDTQGHKYSKSSQNFEPPEQMLDDYGAEILRLWVAAVDYQGDVMLSNEVLDRIADAYRKIRNTFRFMLGNLQDFDGSMTVEHSELEDIDQWVLDRTAKLVDRVQDAYEDYDFHLIYHALNDFATVTLSNTYMDVAKDRLYCEHTDSSTRRSAQTVFWHVLRALTRLSAPILSFTAEEAWNHLSDPGAESVFLTDFPEVNEDWEQPAVSERWDQLLELRDEVQRALEDHRTSDREDAIGSSQEAKVTISAKADSYELLTRYEQTLRALFIVSEVELEEASSGQSKSIECSVEPAPADKCSRCWNYWVEHGSDSDICARCQRVVEQLD